MCAAVTVGNKKLIGAQPIMPMGGGPVGGEPAWKKALREKKAAQAVRVRVAGFFGVDTDCIFKSSVPVRVY